MSDSVELWIVRHGETEWSASGKHTSRTDIPLTDKGRARAEKLREYLKTTKFDAVFVSPMRRARETCDIAGFGKQAIVEDQLKEWAEKEGIKKTILALDNPAGPENMKVDKDADVTVVLYLKKTVKYNYAFKKGDVNKKAVDQIVGDMGKLNAEKKKADELKAKEEAEKKEKEEKEKKEKDKS